jgi:hypothetical protein
MMSPASSIVAGGLARMVALRVRLAQSLTGILTSEPSAVQFVSALGNSLHDAAGGHRRKPGSMSRNAPSLSRHRGRDRPANRDLPVAQREAGRVPEFVCKLSDASLRTQISEARSVGILGTNVSASSLFSQ